MSLAVGTLLDIAEQAGDGPLACSTSVMLEPWPAVVFDTNGYYAELGVPPSASRRELREAYQRLGGERSPRLTYILRQLLDPETRAAYDATPLGSLFLDAYVAESLRRLSATEAAARRRQAAQRGEVDEPLEMVDWDDLLGQTPESPPGKPRDHDDPALRELFGRDRPWGYSYLLAFGSGHGRFLSMVRTSYEGVARRWQQALVRAFGASRCPAELVVGLHDGEVDVTSTCHGPEGRSFVVAFLRCDVTDDHEMAMLAERVVAQTAGR